MTTLALIGLGTTLELADIATPTVFTAIAEVFNINPPSTKDDTIEATHYQSPNRTREFIAGLSDMGELTLDMNYVPGSAGDLALQAAKGVTKVVRITWPNGVNVVFNGIRTSYQPTAPVDGRMTATVGFKVSGDVTQGAAAAPTNTYLPSISGILTSGSLLTANEGNWTGAPQFTYQWKRNAVNVAGATNKTYTLVAGDVGQGMTVTVTGTNSVGNASATSPKTANVA